MKTPKRAKIPFPVPPDPDLAWITPRQANIIFGPGWVGHKKISARMLIHWVKVTIGETTKPADGRGSSRLFSIRDISIMAVGIILSETLGLSPYKVGLCCAAVRKSWDDFWPEPFAEFFTPINDYQLKPVRDYKYVVGHEPSKGGFEASVVAEEELLGHLHKFENRAAVVMNATSVVMTVVQFSAFVHRYP